MIDKCLFLYLLASCIPREWRREDTVSEALAWLRKEREHVRTDSIRRVFLALCRHSDPGRDSLYGVTVAVVPLAPQAQYIPCNTRG